LFSSIHVVKAAVAPNGQGGTCGPYYIWYQMSAEDYPYPMEYVCLSSIIFDISDVVDDFDFVYFTDTAAFQRASLDRDKDGVSDLFFVGRNKNQLEWRPDGGCIRINLRECQGTRLNDRCGYAMISIQPKSGFRDGSARIPIHVTAQYMSNGADCSRSYIITHNYSNCLVKPLPDFIVQKKVDKTYGQPEFKYTITVQNTTETKGSTELIDTITEGTNGGKLWLFEIKINECPSPATCTLTRMTNDQIHISFVNLPPNGRAEIKYTLEADITEIHREEVSYFTNTAKLSNGSSSQVIVGIEGKGPRRPERPIQTQRGRP
jgi:hypothetical protein